MHRLWLPGTMLLQLPRMLFGSAGRPPLPEIADSARWRSRPCGRFRHGRGLHGLPRSDRRLPIVPQGGDQGLHSMPWRCAVAIRLLRGRHLISDYIRRHRALYCAEEVLEVLWAAAEAAASGGSCPFRFVDVGASLGDCTLAAAALLPEGCLQGMALDGDPKAVGMLRQSVALNGLSGPSANASVQVRQVMLSDSRHADGSARVDGNGVTVAHVNAAANLLGLWAVPTSTLDRELRRFGRPIDLTSIFGALGLGISILRGAQGLLREGRVRCLLVRCFRNDCPEFISFFEDRGYRTQLRGRWVAASPMDLGSVCPFQRGVGLGL
mmetsp:Transcript_219/g.642  ORF Transcript_219/g.642 Transcript_219/m.642 type:complete len:324 (+) Transcript_219:3-974(+)